MANEYISSTELKATLSLTGETFADADVADAVEAASRGIDQACNRRFYADADVNQVRHYTPSSRNRVFIDDLVTLTTVKTDTSGDYTWATTITENTDFLLGPFNAVDDGWPYTQLVANPRRSYVFDLYPKWVQVTGKFGWSATPPAVVEATTILASKLLRRAREAPFGVVGLGLDGSAVRIARTDPDVAFLIGPFARLTV